MSRECEYQLLVEIYEHAKLFVAGDEDGAKLSTAIYDYEMERDYPDPDESEGDIT